MPASWDQGLSLNFLWSGGKGEGVETPLGIPPTQAKWWETRPESGGEDLLWLSWGQKGWFHPFLSLWRQPQGGWRAPVSLLLILGQASQGRVLRD